jgi:two-component system chemotaxis sensor kinase CheA
VQYRDQIMTLIDVSTFFGDVAEGTVDQKGPEKDSVSVVVYGDTGHYIGLMVRRVEDITEQILNIKGEPNRDGVLFTAVIDGRVREFLDVESIIQAMVPSYFVGAA